MKLSVVSHYYNNTKTVLDALAAFREMSAQYPGQFDFVLVDDYSHEPIDETHFDGIENLRLFRIIDDVAWNQPGARNIGVKEAKCEKVLLFDIDHYFPAHEVPILMADVEGFLPGHRGQFKRSRVIGKTITEIDGHMNSFLIHKADFERIGGYDERFSGNYAHDDKFFKICCKRHKLTEVQLNATFYNKPGTSTRTLDRDQSVNRTLLDRLIAEEVSSSEKYLTFRYEQVLLPQ